jgi:hypothetical protein
MYAIVDYCDELDPASVRVLAYRATPEGFVRILPNERGWAWLEPVGVWLAGEGELAVCYDAEGHRIPDYAELTSLVEQLGANMEEAAALTEEAVQARQVAEAQAREAERARHEAEAQAAEAARARQEAEARSNDLASRLQEMEAELRRLRGGK